MLFSLRVKLLCAFRLRFANQNVLGVYFSSICALVYVGWISIRPTGYVKFTHNNGNRGYCDACNIPMILGF